MQEEEGVISAHRKEVEDTMEIVREVCISQLNTRDVWPAVFKHELRYSEFC